MAKRKLPAGYYDERDYVLVHKDYLAHLQDAVARTSELSQGDHLREKSPNSSVEDGRLTGETTT